MKHLLESRVPGMVRSGVLARAAAAAIFAAAVVAVPAVPALAGPPPPTPAAPARAQGERLENMFKLEQNRLAGEEKRLTQASKLATRIQGRIDNQKAKGKDTTKLESALADFKAGIVSAQSFLDTAKSALDARAGFDANGKVVDIAKARETVGTAGKAERQAYQTMRKAFRELRHDVREYRKGNAAKSKGAGQRGEKPSASKS